jgi:hypothetical protein
MTTRSDLRVEPTLNGAPVWIHVGNLLNNGPNRDEILFFWPTDDATPEYKVWDPKGTDGGQKCLDHLIAGELRYRNPKDVDLIDYSDRLLNKDGLADIK